MKIFPGFRAKEPSSIANEAERLEWQANFLGEIENQIMEDLGLPNQGKILEVGCGTGDVLIRLQKFRGGHLELLGLDRSTVEHSNPSWRLKAELAKKNLDERYEVVDAITGTYPCDDADMTYARLLLRHVSDAQRVVAKMRDATRIGGRVILVDSDDGGLILGPDVEGFAEAVRGAHDFTRRLAPGATPEIGRRLVSLAHDAGLTNISHRVLTLSTNELSPPGFIELLGPYHTAAINGFTAERNQRLEGALNDWAKKKGAFAMWPLVFVGGTVERHGDPR